MKFQSLAVILLILSITAIDAGRYSGERNGYRRNRGRNSRRGGFNRGRFGLGFPGFGFGVGGFGLGLGYGALGLGVGGVGLGGIGLGGVGLGGVGLGGVGLGGVGVGGVGLGGVGVGGVGLGGVGVGGVGLGGVGVAGVQGVTGAVNTNGVINNNGLVNTAGVINNNRLVNSAGVVNNNRYANTAGAVNTFGKRSMANETMTILPVMEETESFCFLNSSALMTSTINCNGPVHNFECQVERELNLEHVEQELESLRIMPASFSKNSSVHEHVVLSFSKEDSMFNNFTLNHDDTSFVFAFFHNETVSEEGFRIKDLECWEEFEEMMTHDEQVNLKISLTL